jgi:hypothetical protein
MAVTLLDDGTDVVIWNGYRYWAENGLVHWEHKDTGKYDSMSVRTTLFRVRGLNDMLKNSQEDTHKSGAKLFWQDEADALQGYIEKMTMLCRKAQNQGMPGDKSAARDLKRRRRTVVSLHSSRAKF